MWEEPAVPVAIFLTLCKTEQIHAGHSLVK